MVNYAAAIKCPTCPTNFIAVKNDAFEQTHCARCTDVRCALGGIRHRMNQQPDATYIFVPQEWLKTIMASPRLKGLEP